MKRYFRKLLQDLRCKLGLHISTDWSYDFYEGYYYCAYCGKLKEERSWNENK